MIKWFQDFICKTLIIIFTVLKFISHKLHLFLLSCRLSSQCFFMVVCVLCLSIDKIKWTYHRQIKLFPPQIVPNPSRLKCLQVEIHEWDVFIIYNDPVQEKTSIHFLQLLWISMFFEWPIWLNLNIFTISI